MASVLYVYPANIYLCKNNDRSTRKRGEASSKVTTKTPERRQQRCFDIFVVNFECISLFFFLVLLLFNLNI